MPLHYRPQRPLQCLPVQIADEVVETGVVGRAVLLKLGNDPHPLLRGGQWSFVDAVPTRDRWRCIDACGAARQPCDFLGLAGDGSQGEQLFQRDVQAEQSAHLGDDPDRHQGVDAMVKHIVMALDLVIADEGSPERGQLFLHVGQVPYLHRSRCRGGVAALHGACASSAGHAANQVFRIVPSALERVGRQCHASPSLAGMDSGPINGHASLEQLPKTRQQLVVLWMLTRWQHADASVARGDCAVLRSESRQYRAGSGLDHQPCRICAQRANRLAVADRLTHLPAPVPCRGDFRGTDPIAAEAGHDGKRRFAQNDPFKGLLKVRNDPVDVMRVESVACRQLRGVRATRPQLRLQRLKGCRLSGHDRLQRAVDSSNGNLRGQQRQQLLFIQCHCRHPSRRQGLHEAAALHHQGKGIVQREHAGQASGGILAHTVAEQDVGSATPMHELLRQGVLHRKEQGLYLVGAHQRGVGSSQECLAQIGAAHSIGQVQALLHVLAKHRFPCMQVASHPCILRPLPWEQQANGRCAGRDMASAGGSWLPCCQRGTIGNDK
nr:hypothetical protein [Stenotrophomonas indicatrix]